MANSRTNNQKLTAGGAARQALREIEDLTGKQTVGATAVEPTDDGWRVEVEVVEEHRIPSSADMLGLFETALDADGGLLSYRRLRRYSRGKSDGS